MKDQVKILWDRAKSDLLSNEFFSDSDAITFSEQLSELLDSHIYCNCFFNSENAEIWHQLLKTIETVKDDPLEFNLNLSKGFLYLKNENHEAASVHLAICIQLKPSCDIPYFLMSSLNYRLEKSEICNSIKIWNAKKALELNYSIRNNYAVGDVLFKAGELSEAIIYYSNAISLSSTLCCAHFNLGNIHRRLQNYMEAIRSFNRCIEYKPSSLCSTASWLPIGLTVTLESLFGREDSNPPPMGNYIPYLNKTNHEINSLRNFFSEYDESSGLIEILSDVNAELFGCVLKSAYGLYEGGKYDDSKRLYDDYQSFGKDLPFDHSCTYCNFKLIKPIRKGDWIFNPHYKKYHALFTSIEKKRRLKKRPSKDELRFIKSKTYSITEIVEFGQYKGLTIGNIIQINSPYLLWCTINLIHFSLDCDIFLKYKFDAHPDYLLALEINLAKNRLFEEIMNTGPGSSQFENQDSSIEGWLTDEEASIAYWNLD